MLVQCYYYWELSTSCVGKHNSKWIMIRKKIITTDIISISVESEKNDNLTPLTNAAWMNSTASHGSILKCCQILTYLRRNLATLTSEYQGGSSVSLILNLEPIIVSTSFCVNKSCSVNSLSIPIIDLLVKIGKITYKLTLHTKTINLHQPNSKFTSIC